MSFFKEFLILDVENRIDEMNIRPLSNFVGKEIGEQKIFQRKRPLTS